MLQFCMIEHRNPQTAVVCWWTRDVTCSKQNNIAVLTIYTLSGNSRIDVILWKKCEISVYEQIDELWGSRNPLHKWLSNILKVRMWQALINVPSHSPPLLPCAYVQLPQRTQTHLWRAWDDVVANRWTKAPWHYRKSKKCWRERHRRWRWRWRTRQYGAYCLALTTDCRSKRRTRRGKGTTRAIHCYIRQTCRMIASRIEPQPDVLTFAEISYGDTDVFWRAHALWGLRYVSARHFKIRSLMCQPAEVFNWIIKSIEKRWQSNSASSTVGHPIGRVPSFLA